MNVILVQPLQFNVISMCCAVPFDTIRACDETQYHHIIAACTQAHLASFLLVKPPVQDLNASMHEEVIEQTDASANG